MPDPISDAFTKIRNASRSHHPAVDVRASKLFACILDVLKQEGFVRAYKPVGEAPSQRSLRVYLKYTPPTTVQVGRPSKYIPAITQLIRVSKPGARIYRKAAELPRVLGGLGIAVVSTSKGIVTEREAYKQRIGGEVICYVW